MAIRTVPDHKNPYNPLAAGYATFAFGTETSNARAVTIQMQRPNRADANVRVYPTIYLSTDANGDTPAEGILAPTGGWTVGTDGSFVTRHYADGLYAIATLTIGSTAERYTTTTTATFRVGGGQFTKAAAANNTFTAAHVITASKFGVVLVQVTAAGVLSTKVPAATQAYDTAALAFAALPGADAGNVALGHIAIANNAGDWVANTDDLTNASDVTTAAFVDAPANGVYPTAAVVVSEADGDIDLTVTETRIRNFYVNVVHPNGTKTTSSVLAFA